MITHTIRAPTIVDTASKWANRFKQNIQDITQHPRYNRSLLPPMGPNTSHVHDHVPWPKLKFSLWLNQIMEEFKVGDYVTWQHLPIILNKTPLFFEIVYINELYSNCTYDSDVDEPMCVTVKDFGGQLHRKCPAQLRKLSPAELSCANIPNKKPFPSC